MKEYKSMKQIEREMIGTIWINKRCPYYAIRVVGYTVDNAIPPSIMWHLVQYKQVALHEYVQVDHQSIVHDRLFKDTYILAPHLTLQSNKVMGVHSYAITQQITDILLNEKTMT